MHSTIHLVAGPIGAGKTTFAKKLAEDVSGVSFSIDDWMASLFAPDMPSPLDPGWIFERVERCNRRIIETSLLIASRGIDVVLDLGFTQHKDRAAVANLCLDRSVQVKLHWLDVPVSERWSRVEKRNAAKGPTFSFEITRPMFDFMEARCEEPDLDELLSMNGRRIDSAKAELAFEESGK